MLNVVLLTVTYKLFMQCRYAECHYAECRYAECHYAECRYAECRGAAAATRLSKDFHPRINVVKLFAVIAAWPK
jgi:hypothetical protein